MPPKPMYVCKGCGSERKLRRRPNGWIETECRNCTNKARQLWLRGVREEVIKHYGGQCACCGESEMCFLCIDHIEGGGRKHRDAVGNIIPWLRSRGFPSGYRVLCYNCNAAREQNGGVCPHSAAS